jgi:hypothetical protein
LKAYPVLVGEVVLVRIEDDSDRPEPRTSSECQVKKIEQVLDSNSPSDGNGEMTSSTSLDVGTDGNPRRRDVGSDRSDDSVLVGRKSTDDDVNEGIHGSRFFVEELNDRTVNLANTLLSTKLFRVSGKVGLLESVLEASRDPFLGSIEFLDT